MIEAHYSRYSIRPESTKMYQNLKGMYWQSNKKKKIVEFVAEFPNCLRVKVEHQKPGGYIQCIFQSGSGTSRRFDSIQVIVDRLTKSAHFLPVRTTYTVKEYAKLYIKEIVWLHEVPISILLDRGAQFTIKFQKFFKEIWEHNRI